MCPQRLWRWCLTNFVTSRPRGKLGCCEVTLFLLPFLSVVFITREEGKRMSSDVESMMLELGKLDTSQLTGTYRTPEQFTH